MENLVIWNLNAVQNMVRFTSENFFVVFADVTHKICINKIKDNELNSNAANFDNTIMV